MKKHKLLSSLCIFYIKWKINKWKVDIHVVYFYSHQSVCCESLTMHSKEVEKHWYISQLRWITTFLNTVQFFSLLSFFFSLLITTEIYLYVTGLWRKKEKEKMCALEKLLIICPLLNTKVIYKLYSDTNSKHYFINFLQ